MLFRSTVFFGGLTVASTSITGSATLVTKVNFPREIVPASAITANAVTALAMLVIAVPLCLALPQAGGSWVPIVMLPVVLALIFCMTIGLGLIVAGVNVYFRDVEHIIAAIGLPWFFLTPIFYTFAQVSHSVGHPWVLTVLHYGNPIAPGVIATQDCLFWGQWPAWGEIGRAHV